MKTLRLILTLTLAVAACATAMAQTQLPDSIPLTVTETVTDSIIGAKVQPGLHRIRETVELDTPEVQFSGDSLMLVDADGVMMRTFNPDPTRAVWLSALCPGLGQLYNRRYWKLPIVVGAFMGLGYATSWNNGMLEDYTRAYRDLMDNDPGTNSYMNFFAPNVTEADLNKTWLESVFRSRKNFFRRNRDLCIISMVGVYLLAMVDAYVDASLAHFDISPDLSFDWAPAVLPPDSRTKLPSVGLQWAFTF